MKMKFDKSRDVDIHAQSGKLSAFIDNCSDSNIDTSC